MAIETSKMKNKTKRKKLEKKKQNRISKNYRVTTRV